MIRLIAVAFGALLLLTSCATPGAAPAEPTVEPAPLEVAALDGNWVLTRTATSDTTGAITLGVAQTRYVVLGVAECDPTLCTGTVLSAGTQDVFVTGEDAGPHATGTYAWDGTALTLTLDTQRLDCTDDAGGILVDDLYASDIVYDLEIIDGESLAAGTASQDIAETGEDTGDQCPSGNGHVEYDVQFLRA